MQEDTNEAFRRYAERRLYHFTQGGNLPNIMLEGGLVCKHGSVQLQKTDIAHGHIQLRRGVRKVPCGSCGTVHDYVPFYLAHRSPMLFSIQMGNVEAYRGKTPSSIVYLVSSLKQIPARGLPYVFTDGNAASSKTGFLMTPKTSAKSTGRLCQSIPGKTPMTTPIGCGVGRQSCWCITLSRGREWSLSR